MTPLNFERIRYPSSGRSLRRQFAERLKVVIVITLAPFIIALILIKPDWFASDESEPF